MIQPGMMLGQHNVLRKIGEGPLAEVFLAEDARSGQEVVLKILKSHLARSASPETCREEEVSPSALLRHSGIVPLLRCGQSEGYFYMTMTYLPGGSVRQCLRDGLSVKQALTIASQVARALAFAHSKGVTHQSLKPENILFNNRGMAVVTDFSVSRALGFGIGVVNREVVADPRYSSPEEMLGLTKLFGRSDLYSLGLVLFEMLTGSLPEHRGRAAKETAPQLPESLQEFQYLIDQLLALRPGARYASAETLLADLEAEVKRMSPKNESPRVVMLPGREGRYAGGAAHALDQRVQEVPAEPGAWEEVEESDFAPLALPDEKLSLEAPAVGSPPPLREPLATPPSSVDEPATAPAATAVVFPRWRTFVAGFALASMVAGGGLLTLWSSGQQPPSLESISGSGAVSEVSTVPVPAQGTVAESSESSASPSPGEVERSRLFAAVSPELRRRFLGALALAAEGLPDDAAFIYRRLISDVSLAPEPYNNLAALMASRGDLDSALKTLEEGFRAHPSYGVLFENLNTLQIELSLRQAFPDEAPAQLQLQLLRDFPGVEAGALPGAPLSAVKIPPGTALPLSAEDLIQVEEVLRDWARVWSSQDVAAYLASYGSAFIPPQSMTRTQWEAQRLERIQAPARIEVLLDQVAVAPQESGGVRVLALQSYRSDIYSDQSLKAFELGREGDRWMILDELSLGRLR